MDFSRGKLLTRKAHDFIPGGCHTYAKGDDQYPELSPAFIDRGKGCHVWDLDGNEFIEYGMGLRAVTLGHAYEPVVQAAYTQMMLGNNFTRPAPLEVRYAEALLSVVDGADMVKFAKDGSTVTTAAIRLARAYTGRPLVAFCQSHPFYSYNDWFIGTTKVSGGVPKSATDLSLGFSYNDIDSLQSRFDAHPGQIACVIMEPEREVEPHDDFLHKVRELCTRHGAVLIFDEMITGFRWAMGGAQAVYGVTPDLSTFGKAIANGFALSALLGRREIMELGGLHHDKERVFLLSTTHGAENHALAAALATLEEYRTHDVVGHLHNQGRKLKTGINDVSQSLGLGELVQVIGRPCNLVFTSRGPDGKPSQGFRTLLLQELIRNGILGPSLVLSFSHSDTDIDKTIEAFGEALSVYKSALNGGLEDYLVGRPIRTVYRSRN
jgi:glutamate-1-semialdehyde 2,1-aminomutase